MSESKDRSRIAASARARRAAERTIVERHRDEFDHIHGDLREAEGLPRELVSHSYPAERDALQARIVELERLLGMLTHGTD